MAGVRSHLYWCWAPTQDPTRAEPSRPVGATLPRPNLLARDFLAAAALPLLGRAAPDGLDDDLGALLLRLLLFVSSAPPPPPDLFCTT